MPEIRGTYRYAEGLTPGRAEDGGLSSLLFDSAGLLADHATFYPDVDADESNTSQSAPSGAASLPSAGALAAGVLVVGVLVAGAVAAPRVIERLKDKRRRAIDQKRADAPEPQPLPAASRPRLALKAIPLPQSLSKTKAVSDEAQ